MKRLLVATGLLATFLFASLIALAQTQSREDILKEIDAKRTELEALEKRFLAPSEEDRMMYADFLRQPDTGLMRLLPGDVYEKKPTAIRGGAAYYSFTERTHEYGNTTDLALSQSELRAGFAGANYGMLTNLGDVPLENVSLETPAARIIAAYSPATDEPKARVEQRRFASGAEIEGTFYKDHVPLKLNSTYVLRSVNYYASDALVAFRVVRIDFDKSAIILWKLLKKYPKPQLARNN